MTDTILERSGWEVATRSAARWVWGVLGVAALAAACGPATPPAEEATGPAVEEGAALAQAGDPAAAWAEAIERAHGSAAWAAKNAAGQALSSWIAVDFGGQRAFEGRMLFEPDLGGTRFELPDGAVVVWDGTTAWVSPAEAEVPQARFHALTWPYFLALPMKLRDPGTRLELLGERALTGTPHEAARLTFAAGTGDTPEDWYVLYREPGTDRLAAAAYIVTYGQDVAAAENEIHAIRYESFEPVEGVLVPRSWTFWNWSEAEGIHGDPIGEVNLTEVEFVDPPPGAFAAPAGAREDHLPGAGPTG